MWQGVRQQLGRRRWLAAAVSAYLALTAVEAVRLSLFDRPQSGAAGVYDWELSPSVPGARPTASQLLEDGGEPGSPPPPATVLATADADDSIRVAWEASSEPVQGYKVQRALLGRAWESAWTRRVDTAREYPAVPGSTYCFRVRSFNGAGHSLYTYPTPPCVVATAPTPFRWTAGLARIVEPPGGPVLTVRIQSGRDAAEGVPVGILIDGAELDNVSVRGETWETFQYYLPVLIPDRPWTTANLSTENAADGGSGAPPARGVAGPDAGSADARGIAELRPWSNASRPDSVVVDIAVGSTLVPAEAPGGGSDRRELGVRLAPLQWSRAIPAEGIGYYAWETAPDGRRFRWTKTQASRPVTPAGSVAVFSLRADHPDVEAEPVRVDVFWNERRVHEIVLRDRSWTQARIDVPGATAGVLSLRVNRTWVPADTAGGADTRALGVAATPIEWR